MKTETLTAYALNELPPDERASLEAQLNNDPALQKQAGEMKDFCALLERQIAQGTGALTPAQRTQLVQRFQSVRTIIRRPLWRRPAFLSTMGLSAAACLAVMLAIQQVKHSAEMTPAQTPAAPAAGLPRDQVTRLKDADEPLAARITVKAAGADRKDFSGFTQVVPGPDSLAAASTFAGVHGARGVIQSNSNFQPPSLQMNDSAAANDARQFHVEDQFAAARIVGGGILGASGTGTVIISGNSSIKDGADVAAMNGALPGGASSLTKSGAGTLILSAAGAYTGAMVINGGTFQVQQGIQDARPAIALEAPLSDMAAPSDKSLRGNVPSTTAAPAAAAASFGGGYGRVAGTDPENKPRKQIGELAGPTVVERRRMPQDEDRLSKAKESSTATRRPIIGNPFTFVAQQPLSTFSLDVDTASYANVRRLLNSGQRPPPDAVRLEELVNYFPYRYEGPAADRPIAVRVDLADAPWQPLHRIARVAVKARDVKGERSGTKLVTVAKDVKLQIEFNPAQVAAYRLIGCEERTPPREDFVDKEDAGEIGAGHTVTALYEIVPAALKYPDGKPLADELKYQGKAAAGTQAQSAENQEATSPSPKPQAPSREIMTVKVRCKEPDGDQSKHFDVAVTDAGRKLKESDRDFQFAVGVAGFGMLLRGSPSSADLTWEGVRRLALAGKGDDDQGARGEFIQLIEKARGLCEERR